MRTINSKKKRFSGFVVVKNQNVFIDTADGTGFHKVIELMESYINILMRFSSCYNKEDIKQDIYVYILEGISKYNPNKGASLSTFLYRSVKNRLIDNYRKKDPLKNKYISYNDYRDFYYDPIEKIDLLKRIQNWDNKWRRAIFRVFIGGDKISDVAKDEGMTPWGLTRAIRKKLLKAKELR